MARKNSLQYELIKNLGEMYDRGYGRSKYKDKQETAKLRRDARANGASYKDTLRIDASKEYIYSDSTFKNYKKHIRYFCRYLEEVHGLKKISVEDSKQYIQSYINYLEQEKGWSPYSVNLSLSAVVKATGGYVCDYEHAKRQIAEIRRGTKEAVHDNINERLFSFQANKILGLRRSQLERLKAGDIRSVMRNGQDVVEVSIKGKGGRMNIQTFYLPEEKEFVLSLKEGKEDNDRIFSTEEIRGHDADYHSARAFRARMVYERAVTDMENNPDMREWYQQEIKRIFDRDKKKLRENLDTPIFARGSHRKWLEEQEQRLDTRLDRTAVMFVSVTCLAHNRTDVSSEFYIQKNI